MDQNQFDALARLTARDLGNRRQALRTLGSALLGGVLAGAAAHLGLPEATQAKPKRRRTGHQRQAHRPSRGAQAAGKGRGKGKKKPHRRHPQPASPLPPGPGPQCAADEKRCLDRETDSGFSCIPAANCCLDQKPCGGACIYRQACCEADRPACGPCDEARCDAHGAWVCGGACCPHEKPCPGGGCVAEDACCPGDKPCPGGGCIPTNQCCAAPPVCGECQVARCVDGSWGCWPDETCGPRCGEGYCPHGMTCHHEGTCCGVPDGGTYWTCVCASGYANHPGCNAYGQCCRTGCCYPYCCEDPRAG